MRALPRLIVSAIGGTLAAAGLLWSMQWLVMREGAQAQAARERPVMEFVRLQREPETKLRKRELPEQPPPPEEMQPAIPEMPPMAVARPVVVRAPDMGFTVPSIPLNMADDSIGAGVPERG